jgi:hypothetical protein
MNPSLSFNYQKYVKRIIVGKKRLVREQKENIIYRFVEEDLLANPNH